MCSGDNPLRKVFIMKERTLKIEGRTVKFMYNGIKINGELTKGWFSYSDYDGKKISFYASSYLTNPELSRLFEVQNNTDFMTDYFEKDKISFDENSPYWQDALNAAIKWEKKSLARIEKRLEKDMSQYMAQEYENINSKVIKMEESLMDYVRNL
jgi:hypothetical protein